MNILRTIRILWNRLRFTGSFRAPRRLTLAELEQLQQLFPNKSKL
jgi:hypothetical protein